jgi:two-component system, sensor histidine kinase
MRNPSPANSTAANNQRIPNRDDQIAAEKIRLVFQHAPLAIAVNPTIGILVVVIDWGYIQHHILWGWFTIVFFTALFRAAVWYQYRKHQPSILESRKWGKLFAIAMASSGFAWGSSAIFLFPVGEIVPQMVIITVIAGLTSGAMASSATYLPLFYAYLFPATLPLLFVVFAQATTLHTALGVMISIYVAGIAWFGRANYLGFAELIDLRIEISVQKDKAEQANIAKSKFLAAASHDLRQPLHALSLLTGTLDKHVDDNQQSRMVLRRINRSVKDLENLFMALLDISKLDAQVVKPEFENFPIQRVITNLESDWIETAHEKGIKWQSKGNAKNVIAYSDPILLVRILTNLISNAVKYTELGKVILGLQTQKTDIEIYVEDTGPGIPKNKQEEIFQEFVQLHNPQRNRELGLGLGLAIVKRLTSLLEYTISIKTEVDKGSRFSIHIPYGDVEKVNTAETNSLKQMMRGFNGLRVLVIDDEENILIGMKSILENWDCQVISAASCEQAISLMDNKQQIPELILADYRLTENKNGLQVISQIRQHCGNDIPALIITGDVAAEQLSKIDDAGFSVLHKPVAPARLRIAMQQMMKLKPVEKDIYSR